MDQLPEQLGGYRVLNEIGRGGMGVVYLAHDDRLERDVAIKVLPDSKSVEDEQSQRFQREAKLLASLNHPNICQVFGLDRDTTPDGVEHDLLIMEYVAGQSLAERLLTGAPMNTAEALRICRQLASGLEAAHERGVIHRDLKPANVRLRDDGVAKVLDFGLAKAQKGWAGAAAEAGDLEAPTLDNLKTEEGRIMGTIGYMSPEQARGRRVDRRTDIWAFGCVLFECLTGGRAFRGETPADILVAILDDE
ncbi:MAG: serine/threonine-protein kinase, partial [Planctomycetota bacterium]